MRYVRNMLVETTYWGLCLMRLLFLSSEAGVRVHNFLLYAFMTKGLGVDMQETGGYAIKIVKEAMHGNKAAVQWERKMYCLAPSTRRRMLRSVFIYAGIIGRRKSRKLEKTGFAVPRIVFVSPTYRCNLNCHGCYAASPRPGDLPFEVLERVVGELESLGIFSVLLLGGEPFVRKDLWLLFERFPRTVFTVYTNGTFLDQEAINRITRLGNMRLLVSMEGFRENTDNRRGAGTYDTVVRCLDMCQRANIVYGVSVTVAQENFEEVVSNKFIEWLVERGAFHVNYIPFMPMGKDGRYSTLTTGQVRGIEEFARSVIQSYPIYPSVGRSGSDLVTNCDAAKRLIHITADGDVEPCMFVPWAAGNIRDQTLLEVLQSDFFHTIRGLNQTGETKLNPCKWQGSRLLELAFRESGAHPTRKEKGGLPWQINGETGKIVEKNLLQEQPTR